jgi:hypothetical protein
MSGLLDGGFDLLVGFGSAHIMIVGILGGLIGAIISGVLWLVRGKFLKALSGIALVVLVPLMLLGIIPGLEFLAVPLALVLLFITFFSHFTAGEDRKVIDTVLSIVLGLALVSFAVVQVLAWMSGPVVS